MRSFLHVRVKPRVHQRETLEGMGSDQSINLSEVSALPSPKRLRAGRFKVFLPHLSAFWESFLQR